jgi:hypothetical protein
MPDQTTEASYSAPIHLSMPALSLAALDNRHQRTNSKNKGTHGPTPAPMPGEDAGWRLPEVAVRNERLKAVREGL